MRVLRCGCCSCRLTPTPAVSAAGLPLQGRATFAPSPYLDAHGEEDKYMKRGK